MTQEEHLIDLLRSQESNTVNCAFYLLLNVGARFLSAHTQTESKINSRVKFVLISCVTFLPIILAYNYLALLFAKTCVFPGDPDADGWMDGMNCTSEYIYVYGSLATATMCVQYIQLVWCLWRYLQWVCCWGQRYCTPWPRVGCSGTAV